MNVCGVAPRARTKRGKTRAHVAQGDQQEAKSFQPIAAFKAVGSQS
jgi:hypothetical protein